ncbi:response regulator [Planctomycetota bacterium]|nr:response regulator [Planctomycetota bacterium]
MSRYYTTSEVAKICNVHRNTIIGAIRKGLLKIHRTPGGHARISQEDLDDFSHRRSLPTTALIARNNRVLIADGNDDLTGILKRNLNDANYLVETATDGFQVGYLLGQFLPNVVLVDQLVEGVPSQNIVRRIRALPKQHETAVIAMLSTPDDDNKRQLHAAGADEVLIKPFDMDDLLEAITRLIGPVVSGTTGRAVTGKKTRRVRAEDDDKATRKTLRPNNGKRTTIDGIMASADNDEEFQPKPPTT